MPDSYEWRMARRAARLAASSGGGLRRAELAELMGVDEGELRRHVGLAYSRRMLDCIRDYVVAPMAVNRPRPLG
jgi:hypothetical protein